MKSQSQIQADQQLQERIETLRKNISADVSDSEQLSKVYDKPAIEEQFRKAHTHLSLALSHITKASKRVNEFSQSNGEGNYQREVGESWKKSQQREPAMG